jgi:hypothetical protein
MMDIRKLLVAPALAGVLALGACGGGEVEDEGVVEEQVVGQGVVEGAGAVEEGATVGTAEILGNGIDDDGDGVVDETD